MAVLRFCVFAFSFQHCFVRPGHSGKSGFQNAKTQKRKGGEDCVVPLSTSMGGRNLGATGATGATGSIPPTCL